MSTTLAATDITAIAAIASTFGWVQDGPCFYTVNNDTVYGDDPYRFTYTPGAYDEGVYVGSFGNYELGEQFHVEREANGLNKSLLNFFGNGKTLGEDMTLVQFRKADKYGNDQFIVVAFYDQDSSIQFWAHADSGESYDDGRIAVTNTSTSVAAHGEHLQGVGGNQRWLLGSLVDEFVRVQ